MAATVNFLQSSFPQSFILLIHAFVFLLGLDKFVAIRNALTPYNSDPIPPEPPAIPKFAYGVVQFEESAPFWALAEKFSLTAIRRNPGERLDFESFGLGFGFALYSFEYSMKNAGSCNLTLVGLHDRALIYLDTAHVGTILRQNTSTLLQQCTHTQFIGKNVSLSELLIHPYCLGPLGQHFVSILVENMGHQNFGTIEGAPIYDPKGFVSGSTSSFLNNMRLTLTS